MVLSMDQRRNDGASSWENLSRTLGGSFTARARGLVNPVLMLARENESFGQLLSDASGRTRFRAGDLEAEIRQYGNYRYVMTTGSTRTLTVEPTGSPTVLSLSSGGRLYEARISLLRNRATAMPSTGNETARISGGLTNRRYKATFDTGDPAALPIAILLLHHTADLRRKAFRARP